MSKRTLPALLILWAVLYVPLHFILLEAFGSALTDRAFEFLERFLGIGKAQMIAAVGPYLVPATFSALAIYAAYRLGIYERATYEPLPDLDPRAAFLKIRSNRKWSEKYTESDPEKRKYLVRDYLDMRLDEQIHAALVQGRIWAWGSQTLPRGGDGPLHKISPDQWQSMEIVFDDPAGRTRAYSK
jgi:hypothetical protein